MDCTQRDFDYFIGNYFRFEVADETKSSKELSGFGGLIAY